MSWAITGVGHPAAVPITKVAATQKVAWPLFVAWGTLKLLN